MSKQVTMRAASIALGLAPDCSTDELKLALDLIIERAAKAKTALTKAQNEAREQVAALDAELVVTRKARDEALGKVEITEAERDKAINQLAAAREANARELKKLTEQVNEKQKAIKAIHVALADTPANIVKKLKKLRTEKLAEANACKRAENEVRSLKRSRKQHEATIEEYKLISKNGAALAGQYRELYEICKNQREQLESLLDNKLTLTDLPAFDENLLVAIEGPEEEEDKAA